MLKKLCIFPNDPIISYYQKGEIKEGYFNPKNYFDKIDMISFIDKDIEEEKIKKIVGDAELKIHSVGKIPIIKRKKNLKKILNIVGKIKPDVIRAYSPLLQGWFAAKCAKELRIPFYLSLHTQFDTNRKLAKKNDLKKFFALKFTEKVLESFVIQNADKITIVFKIIEPYVIKHGGKKPILLHNGVDYDRFVNAEPLSNLPKPLILSIGNLIPEKNHDIIIESMKNLDAFCMIIGKGPLKNDIIHLIQKLRLEDKILLKDSIPHEKIHQYYKTADIFTLAYEPDLEGLPMPVIEALASGKPVVIPRSKQGFSEGLENSVIFAEKNVQSFTKKLNQLLNDKILQETLGKKAIQNAKRFDRRIIEEQEIEIYSSLIKQYLK